MVLLIPKTVKAILARGRQEEHERLRANFRRVVAKRRITDLSEIEDEIFNDRNGKVNGAK